MVHLSGLLAAMGGLFESISGHLLPTNEWYLHWRRQQASSENSSASA
jgi:hypothetical protein